jgi:MinD-like ATPase involved in chromosome partitioning or flagellar assembly
MRHTATSQSYRHILPLGDDKLDMFAVFNRVHPQVTKWVELFYSQAYFETDIHAEFNHAEIFRHFYFESKNIQKTRGQQSFGFGFPLLFDETTALSDTEKQASRFLENKELIAAPLFIWYLSIKPHPTRRDSWLIAFDENNGVTPNPYLLAHIQQKYSLDLTATWQAFIQNRPLSFNGLKAFCLDLAERLGFPIANINPALRECPSGVLLTDLAQRGDIAWAGAVGLFPHADGSLSELARQATDFQNFTWTAEHAHEFTLLPEDVYQREALRSVLRNKITVVEGGHGTGKTHLAANILFNALSNGQKTAVVADDIASLMQVQNEFVKQGLGNLTFLLKDVLHDKKLLLDVLRNEQYGKSYDFKEVDFKVAVKQGRRLLSKSDDSHDALSRPIFGDLNFSEVVGLYLQSQRRAGRELLANHLNAAQFAFTKAEYADLKTAIANSQMLFVHVNTLKHPLSNLSPQIFITQDTATGHQFAKQTLTKFIEKFDALHHRCIAVYDAYAQKLLNHYESYYAVQREELRHLKEAYSDYQFQYGADFESSNLLRVSGLYASSLFSDRSKNVLSAKDEAVRSYDAMAKTHASRKHFQHEFLKGSEKKDFKKLKLNLETFELSLRGWRKALPALVQEELQRLNAKTAKHFDPIMAEQIADLEAGLETLLAELNESGLYGTALSHKMLTLPKRMLFIEETLEKLEDSKLNLRDFEGFYAWQNHWLQLSDNGRELITALTKVKPSDWSAAFDSWYFYNTLVIHYQSNTLGNDSLMDEMNAVEDRLRSLLTAQIGHLWHERKKQAIRDMKSKNADAWKLFFNPKNQELAKGKYLKDILRGSIQTLSEVYPVLLITPQVATQIIEAEGKEFDLVIFDNAQNLDTDTVLPIMRNTEGVVILAESAPSDTPTDSFVGKAKAEGAACIRLNYLHRPLSETTRRINQSVFYPEIEVPFRQPAAEQSVSVHFSQGKFYEKLQTNEAEIVEVVRILEEVSATPFNTYPRIGVVTMTAQQRNTLNMNLLNIVQKTLYGWEKIEQLQRNGLTILQVDELAGLQFDILVVSGTYADFETMRLSKRAFRQLLNSFTKQLYWVNSIPKLALEKAAASRDFEMPFLVSNLILLAENLVLGSPQYELIFKNLGTIYGKPKTQTPSLQESLRTVFVDEIIIALSPFVEKKRLIKDFKMENHLFPLVILPTTDEEPFRIIRIDGRLSQKGQYFNADWERRMMQDLDKLKVQVLSIWSYNWWKNPAAEAQQIVEALKTPVPLAPNQALMEEGNKAIESTSLESGTVLG